jgi:hypothetical protein
MQYICIGCFAFTSEPSHNDMVFQEWRCLALMRVSKHQQKGFYSLVILVAWWLWKTGMHVFLTGPLPVSTRLSKKLRMKLGYAHGF